MSARKFLAGMAAAAMVVAPVASQAGTRAESSPVTVDIQRGSADITAQNELNGRFNLAWLLLLVAVIAAIVLAGGGGGRTRG